MTFTNRSQTAEKTETGREKLESLIKPLIPRLKCLITIKIRSLRPSAVVAGGTLQQMVEENGWGW
ncbi:MAG: hypothetical protein B6243_10815 [Anaerolineaceae bacterium 4572_5.2]|nr:MAG: hypothetical protein B6243_10815 [Anaerolineaceae bacterium 4572_5.2]